MASRWMAGIVGAGWVVGSSAGVLDTADALWKFDGADSGAVSLAEVSDSSGNGHNASSLTSASFLNWSTTPVLGPGGADAVDTFGVAGRGLEFNPRLVVDGSTNSPATDDTVNSPGFTVSGFKLAGSSTFITRFKWDGYACDDSTARSAWLFSNGGAVQGYLFGLTGATPVPTFYQHLTTYGKSPAGFPEVQVGVWYDMAIVVRDDAEEGGVGDYVTFFMYPEGGTLYTQTVALVGGGGSFTNDLTTGSIIVGSETLGQGTSNQRKGFGGTIDYIGVWDHAVSDTDVISMIVPEPATGALLGIPVVVLLLRRRRG